MIPQAQAPKFTFDILNPINKQVFDKTQTIVYFFLFCYWHEHMFMIRYNQEREVIGMKFIMKNKGVLLFYLIIIVSSLIIINDVERDNVLNNNDNTYVAIIQK